MKKFTLLIFLLAIVVFFAACSEMDIDSDNNNSENYVDTSIEIKDVSQTMNNTKVEEDTNIVISDIQRKIHKEDENYVVFSYDNLPYLNYIIYDNKQNVLDMGYHDGRGGFDISSEGSLLVLNYGVGGNTWYERYYDTSKGSVSRFFCRPVQSTEKLVAYFEFREPNKIVLIVQNIFNPNELYLEIERDFSDFVIKDIAKAEFLESETKLKITYWINPKNEIITELIDLEKLKDSSGRGRTENGSETAE